MEFTAQAPLLTKQNERLILCCHVTLSVYDKAFAHSLPCLSLEFKTDTMFLVKLQSDAKFKVE